MSASDGQAENIGSGQEFTGFDPTRTFDRNTLKQPRHAVAPRNANFIVRICHLSHLKLSNELGLLTEAVQMPRD
jgi:hypothetical protein